MASSDTTEAPLSDPVAVALFKHVKTIITEHASLDDNTKKTYVAQARSSLVTSFAKCEDLKSRAAWWCGALTVVVPEMERLKSIPKEAALYKVANAAKSVSVPVQNLLLHFEELPGATFIQP
jgi:hypothetical protein